ncbi:phosphoenolpyruvate carboxylase [Methanobacterium formicicum DSM 3637]|uniref:Phosphoenolpyruvate carboxylase n=2 Tax=Methanobacterium formicicum TaxID=2162 RepID=K2QAG9_METFP|nr:phosphoenolpyruvate carboxylase [Methanobacterium formicicum DSM 3637]
MSTQHPDNVNSPFFSSSNEIGGEDEIAEAYYVFSHLGCDEQMWDCEGKEVDNYVVKKLLTRYGEFFNQKKLGEDLRLTLRVPNPTVEKAEAKILLETLESIPRSFDVAKLFYGEDIAPVFEIILPMTGSARCIDRIYRYYSDFVIGKQNKSFKDDDITIAEWIGEFKPTKINAIPLFEDREGMLNAHEITRKYLSDKDIHQQRIFLARSDPAMNYGLIGAVLMNKLALYNFNLLSEDTGVDIYPIIGVGSAPFRGNLKPQNIENLTTEYPSVHTFTIQSSFKYDHPTSEVIKGIEKLKSIKTSRPHEVDPEKFLEIIDKYGQEFQKQILELAPPINSIAKHTPNRRKRKLHIGLFGYSRNIDGISLPRAISFTCALYSLGLPPEVLALNALDGDDFAFLDEYYLNFRNDLKDALQYLNLDSPFLPEPIKERLKSMDYVTNEEHKEITDQIIDLFRKDNVDAVPELILRAANLRKFVG